MRIIFFIFFWFFISFLTAVIVKNSYILAVIYFTFFKIVLYKTWKLSRSNLDISGSIEKAVIKSSKLEHFFAIK